jgi:hypothetical protein
MAGFIIPSMAADRARRPSNSRFLQSVLVLVLLALAVLIVLNQANPLTTRLGRDSGMYAYVASHVLRGHTPYISAWEHKPPGIFFIDALGLSLAGGTRWGIWTAEFVFLFAAALAGFNALKQHFSTAPALGASLIWLAGMGLVLEGGNFTEEFSLPFSFLSLLLFGLTLKRPAPLWLYAALGLATGCSFMIRPNNAGVQMAIVLAELVLVLRKERAWGETLRGWLALGVGFILPVAAAAAYFLARGAFEPFLEAAFLFNAAYGGRLDLLGSFISGVRHLGFAAGVALVGILFTFGKLRDQLKKGPVNPILLWLSLDFVLEIILSGLSGRNYPHYFISWLPWIAFSCAALLSTVPASLESCFQRFAVPALLAAISVLALGAQGTLRAYADAFRQLTAAQGKVQRQEQLPQYINEHTQPGDTVYVWGGEAGINFLARRDAPTAHFSYAQLGPSPFTERLSNQFYEDILAHPPALILDQAGDSLPPLSTQDPVQWLTARNLYVTPYIREFFDFVHARYSYRTDVAGVPIYVLGQ